MTQSQILRHDIFNMGSWRAIVMAHVIGDLIYYTECLSCMSLIAEWRHTAAQLWIVNPLALIWFSPQNSQSVCPLGLGHLKEREHRYLPNSSIGCVIASSTCSQGDLKHPSAFFPLCLMSCSHGYRNILDPSSDRVERPSLKCRKAKGLQCNMGSMATLSGTMFNCLLSHK